MQVASWFDSSVNAEGAAKHHWQYASERFSLPAPACISHVHLCNVRGCGRFGLQVVQWSAACQCREYVGVSRHHSLGGFHHQAAAGLAGQVERDRPHTFAVRVDLDAVAVFNFFRGHTP